LSALLAFFAFYFIK